MSIGRCNCLSYVVVLLYLILYQSNAVVVDLPNDLTGEYCGIASLTKELNDAPAVVSFGASECNPSTMTFGSEIFQRIWCDELPGSNKFSHGGAMINHMVPVACGHTINETAVPYIESLDLVATACFDHSMSLVDATDCFTENPSTACITSMGSAYSVENPFVTQIQPNVWENNCLFEGNPVTACVDAEFYCISTCFSNSTSMMTVSDVNSGQNPIEFSLDGNFQCLKISMRKLFPRTDHSSSDIPLGFINFEKRDKKIKIDTTIDLRYIVLVTKGSFSQFYDFSGIHYEIILPDAVLVNSGVMNVKLSANSKVIAEEDFDIIGFNTCDLIDCIFCMEFFNSIGCMPAVYKAALIMLFAGILIAMILALPSSLVLFAVVVRIIMWILTLIKWLVNKYFIRKVMNSYSKLDESMKEMETERAKDNASVTTRTNRKSAVRIPLNTACLMVICCLSVAFGCDDGLVIPVNLQSCSVSGQVQTCTLTFDSLMVISGIQSKVCLTFAADSNKTHVASFTASLDSAWSRNLLNELYTTSDYEPHVESFHSCFSLSNNDFCTDQPNSGCAQVNSNRTLSLDRWFVESDPFLKSFPGRSECSRTPGCAWNGCFLCNDACVTSRYSIRPKGQAYKVNALVGKVDEAEISVNFDHDGEDIKRTCIGSANTCDLGKIRVQLLNVETNAEFTPGSERWIRSQFDSFMAEASAVNSPVAGQIGEIQAKSPADLSNGRFIIPDNIGSLITGSHAHSYSFNPSGIAANSGAPRLPLVVPNGLLIDKQGTLQTNLTHAQVKLRVSTSEPLTVTRIVNVVCPTIVSISVPASGCFQCSEGWSAVLIAKSTCSSGKVMISSSDGDILIYTASAQINTTDSMVILQGSTNKVNNQFKVALCATDKCDSIDMSFTAIPGVEVRNDSDVTVSSQTGINKVPVAERNWFDVTGNFFIDAFSGKGTIMEYIVVSLILLTALVFIMFIIYKMGPIKRGKSMLALLRMKKNV